MSWQSLLLLAGNVAGQVQSAGTSARQKEYQAEMAEKSAVDREEAASRELNRLRNKARAEESRQRARFSARGVTSEGSPGEALVEDAADTELDLFDRKQTAYEAAEQDRARAGLYRYLADRDRQSGWLKTGRTLLSGLSKLK